MLTFELLETMSEEKLGELSAPIMGHIYQSGKAWKEIEGTNRVRLISSWNPAEDIYDAMQLANKLGIVAIPQSSGNGFRWYVCDVECVHYRGGEIAIVPIENTELSQDTAARAITICAILSSQRNKNS